MHGHNHIKFEMILSLNFAQYPAAAWALLFDCGRFDVVLLFNSFVLDSLFELNYRQGQGVFFPIVASTQPRIYRVSGALFAGVKRLGLESDHPPPSSGEVKKYWGCTCALMACKGNLHLVSY